MDNIPVLEIDEYGNKHWKLNGDYHRTDGPAIERSNGDKFWYSNGKRHREDGPVAEYSNGYNEWFLNNNEYSFEEWLELTPLSEKEKVRLRLKYAMRI